MDADMQSPTAPGADPASHARSLTDRELATAAGGIVAGALLLRMQPVRSLLKWGLWSAAGWAAWHCAGRLVAPAMRPDGGADGPDDALVDASRRLADAWGARYRAPQSGNETHADEQVSASPRSLDPA